MTRRGEHSVVARKVVGVAVAAGVPYGATMGVLAGLISGHAALGLWAGLFAGSVFGIVLSAFLCTMHHGATRSLPASPEAVWRVRHRRHFVLPLPVQEACAACAASLSAVPGCKITKLDPARGRITARKEWTWKSVGDEIEFRLRTLGPCSTQIDLTSRPRIGTTVLDLGSNLENVVAIMAALGASDSGALLRPSSAPIEGRLLRPASSAPDAESLLRPAVPSDGVPIDLTVE